MLASSYRPFELLVIDDRSTDDTPTAVAQLARGIGAGSLTMPAAIATALSAAFWMLVSAGMKIPPVYGLAYPAGDHGPVHRGPLDLAGREPGGVAGADLRGERERGGGCAAARASEDYCLRSATTC